MVGVAGRSKGCVTCRKRKKGCDLKRPSCSQCLERKIQCGGYDLDRVFVRSKYDPIPPTTTPAVPGGSASDAVALTASTYQVMPTSLARTAFTTKGTEAVFELFPAQEGSGGVLLANSFWQFLASLSTREEPLRQTIFAIGLVALGKGYNDQMVLRKGRTMYGKALQELGASLQNPGRGSFEALLATTRLMGFFEILYGTEGEGMTQAQIWMSHAQGEIALIVSKGPEAFREGPAHLLFTLARYNAAIIGTRSRRHMVFNEKHWKTIPWQAREKPASDTIVDILLEIPEILGELDYLDHMTPDDPRFNDLRLMMVTKCWTVHCNLNAWIARNFSEVYTPPTDEPIPIEFPNLIVASVSLKYWATATLLYQSLDRALRYSVNETLPPYLNRPHGRPFARLITRSASWLFSKENGAIGPTTLSFPLGVAMMYIRQSGVPDLDYMKLVFAAWSAPEWPRSIKAFLMSMGNTIPQPTHNRSIPENPVTWSTREMEAVADIDGNLLADPFVNQSRYKPV